MRLLVKILKTRDFLGSELLITGRVYTNGPVYRNPKSKWYVPKYVYEKNRYPDYTNGTIFL